MVSDCEFISSWRDQINCGADSKLQQVSERQDNYVG